MKKLTILATMLALALMIATPAAAQTAVVDDDGATVSVGGVNVVADDDFGFEGFPFEGDLDFGGGFPFDDDDDFGNGSVGTNGDDGDDSGMDDDDDDDDD